MNPELIEEVAAIIGDPVKTEAVVALLRKENERSTEARRQRQADGIRAARERGVRFGRPYLKIPKNFPALYEKYLNKEITVTAASQELHISRASFHRVANRYLESIGELPEQKKAPSAE